MIFGENTLLTDMKVQLPPTKSPFLWLRLQVGYHGGKRNPIIIIEHESIMLSFSLKIKDIYSFFKKEKKRKNRLNNIKEQNDIQAVD